MFTKRWMDRSDSRNKEANQHLLRGQDWLGHFITESK